MMTMMMKNPHKTEYKTHVRKTAKYCHVLAKPFDVPMVVTYDLIMVLEISAISKILFEKTDIFYN